MARFTERKGGSYATVAPDWRLDRVAHDALRWLLRDLRVPLADVSRDSDAGIGFRSLEFQGIAMVREGPRGPEYAPRWTTAKEHNDWWTSAERHEREMHPLTVPGYPGQRGAPAGACDSCIYAYDASEGAEDVIEITCTRFADNPIPAGADGVTTRCPAWEGNGGNNDHRRDARRT